MWLSSRGDPSNDFRLATFFPEFLHPAIDGVAAVVAKLLGMAPQEAGESRSAFVLQAAPLPGSDSAESARRR